MEAEATHPAGFQRRQLEVVSEIHARMVRAWPPVATWEGENRG